MTARISDKDSREDIAKIPKSPITANGRLRSTSPEFPMSTPKGFIRVKTTAASCDLGNKSVFILDLSKVSRAPVRIPASTTLTRVPTQRNLNKSVRDVSPFRSINSRFSYADMEPAPIRYDEPIKYDLNKSIYERQKEWKNKLDLKLEGQRNFYHEVLHYGHPEARPKWSPKHKARQAYREYLKKKIRMELIEHRTRTPSPVRTERYETPIKSRLAESRMSISDLVRSSIESDKKTSSKQVRLTVETDLSID
eukprot:CAMPEP_0204905890 /NCGR_PEP_ID=MMETSP1397-20131031/5677_1 /ASSEMBLY_ACC=CAM_ASM_000891 /TAXON_ID=49980 /ORGANISM="Climacostomum Climacostomum virens, Strain Stock W-24" /LENGTH=251 /DNA_ID=CAMNT_0052074835 /DNA_START=18 /DNA_END=771 /DNA_ORIENTATION=-